MLERERLCVVLNNQHEIRIKEFTERCAKDPAAYVVFQPYTARRLRSVSKLLLSSAYPVPIFFVSGNFGTEVIARGILHSVEYRPEVSVQRLREIQDLISEYDEGVYATNFLLVSNVTPLSSPASVTEFVKKSDGKPLKPSRTPAIVCYLPARLA